MPDYQFVTYETLDDGTVARIMLNRPEARNAQNRGLLVDLGNALLEAEADDRVRVVILGGLGPMFSSGHDMGSEQAIAERTPGPSQHPTVAINGGTRKGAEALMLQEWHYYFDNTRRWRNLRKITVAQVHGTVYAAGLMLMWACDLIVAAETPSSPTSWARGWACAGWSTSRIRGSSGPARPRSSCSPAIPSMPMRPTSSA